MNKEDKKAINELVQLYFLHNPHMNKGLGFKVKANDIIKAYYTKHNMSYEEIKECIESNPMCQNPIWDQFYNYWYKNKNLNNKKKEKSNYKNSINDSTDVNDWI